MEDYHLPFSKDLNGRSFCHRNSQIQDENSLSADSDVIPLEIIPIGSIASDDEIIETYEVQEDGSLLQIMDEIPTRKLTRKRKKNYKGWKRNIAKVNRQSGKEYKNTKGEIQPARGVKSSGCSNPGKCKLECMKKIDANGRQAIFDSFWRLNDSEKRHFYVSNVKKARCVRKRTNAAQSRKSYVLKYHFNYLDEDIPVCQQFFVNTLNVNKGRVYYYFNQNKGKPTVTPGAPRHGTHRKKVISEEQKQGVRDHINKFPTVESHYCRQNSEKQYLYQGLNLATMYRLYVAENENPTKLSAYRNIFNFEYNLSFFRPKKDRCSICLAFEKLSDPTDEQVEEQNLHLLKKVNASNERTRDRDITPFEHQSKRSAVGAFDMENVFQLPRSNASIVYYKRKFSVLNLTVVLNKIVYNATWDESLCGREGVHIANALVKILKKIVEDNPLLEQLTLWSDSCVPQNRNSIMSAAIQYFLNSSASKNLKQIDQKFSESGHGLVQEVDSAHSVIERFLRHKFIYSPPSLIEEISKIPEQKLKFVIVPMEENDYSNYHLLAQAYKYSVVPFTKVKQLTYKKNQSEILLKFDFNEPFQEKVIQLKSHTCIDTGDVHQLALVSKLSAAKISDIESMYGIMAESDRLFYQNIFKNAKELQVDIAEGDFETSSSGIPERQTVDNKSNRNQSKQSRLPLTTSKSAKMSKLQLSAAVQASNVIIDSQLTHNSIHKAVHRLSQQVQKTPSLQTSAIDSTKSMEMIIELDSNTPEIQTTLQKPKRKRKQQSCLPLVISGIPRNIKKPKLPPSLSSVETKVIQKVKNGPLKQQSSKQKSASNNVSEGIAPKHICDQKVNMQVPSINSTISSSPSSNNSERSIFINESRSPQQNSKTSQSLKAAAEVKQPQEGRTSTRKRKMPAFLEAFQLSS